MAFVQRLLTVSLSLANGQFAGGGNSATLTGLRTSCKISVMGGDSSGTAQLAIFGMRLDQMNQLTSLPQFKSYGQNTVTIQAGDGDGNGNPAGAMTTVFSGHIFNAWMDGAGQPQVPFRIEATSDGLQRVKPAAPTSVKGSGDVATLMGNLAKTMGLTFENNGVNIKLNNPYFWGSPRMQAMDLARAAGIEHVVNNGTLAIWPAGQARQGGGSAVISPQTGMVSYPTFYAGNILVKTLFNPAIEYGQKIQVQSDLQAACGSWTINKMEYELDALMPKGRWFQVIQAYGPGTPPP